MIRGTADKVTPPYCEYLQGYLQVIKQKKLAIQRALPSNPN